MRLERPPLPTLVGVVTTRFQGTVNAAPVSWFTPCSYEPPMMVLAVKRKADTALNIRQSKEFVLQTVPYDYAQLVHNMAEKLSRDQSEVVKQGLDVVPSDTIEVPRLGIALQWYECALEKRPIMVGTHVLFIAIIRKEGEAERSKDEVEPLLYFGGLKYSRADKAIDVKPY